jgi:formylglycine-generating enzyme required for sulfatase activity
MKRRINTVWALAAVGLGCQSAPLPEGQLLVHFNTDAPVPTLFDRLRIEIFPSGADESCAGCSREFGVDAALFATGRASIGIVPPERGARARVRLYRSGGTASSEPRPASTIEQVVALPVLDGDGIVEITVTLWTDDVARPRGTLEAPIDAEPGAPELDLVGSWPGAAVVDCASPPSEDEVCVPGGAFWMGDPRLDLSATFDMGGSLERLVVLSPYFLDREEVDVASFRASGLAIPPAGPSDDPHEAGGSIEHCTYTSAPGAFEEHPVNCLSWNRARLFCEQAGKVLPTEAQLENAMSAFGQSPFVWGTDAPRCEDAVFEREGECAHLGAGPAPSGSGARDRLALTGGEAVDLAGNVIEWAADSWNRDEEPCWGTGVFFDPRCDAPSPIDGPARSLRGNDWQRDMMAAAVRTRLADEMFAVSARVGFRCARLP